MSEAEKKWVYAIVYDGQLEHYTRNGWEFVKMVEAMGHQILQYTPPPSYDSNGNPQFYPPPENSGGVMLYAQAAALVRRTTETDTLEDEFNKLKKRIEEDSKAHSDTKEELSTTRKRVEELGEHLESSQGKLKDCRLERDDAQEKLAKLQEEFAAIELHVGRKEMNRILMKEED